MPAVQLIPDGIDAKHINTKVYNVKGMDITGDESFKVWNEALLIHNENTGKLYKIGLEHFCEFIKKTPSKLIGEAREDYINRVPPWDLRHIKDIEAFINYMKSLNGKENVSNNTKNAWIKAVKHFYAANKIPVIGVKAQIPAVPREEYLDIPLLKIEDIRAAVEACGVDKMRRALFLTSISSAQGSAEITKLKGKHLKNRKSGVAIINTSRDKDISKHRYIFFIGAEALQAIAEYKPNLEDDEYIFTPALVEKRRLKAQEVVHCFSTIAEKCGFPDGYFNSHRSRHYFETMMTGNMDSDFIDYVMGHTLPGVKSNYFIGQEDKLLEAYLKNQHLLSIFTSQEILQRQYDELKRKHEKQLSAETGSMRNDIEQIKQEKSRLHTENEELKQQLANLAKDQAELRQYISTLAIVNGNVSMKTKPVNGLKDYPEQVIEEGKEWQLIATGEIKRNKPRQQNQRINE
jgi:integrase/regulator of replication initiation timing